MIGVAVNKSPIPCVHDGSEHQRITQTSIKIHQRDQKNAKTSISLDELHDQLKCVELVPHVE